MDIVSLETLLHSKILQLSEEKLYSNKIRGYYNLLSLRRRNQFDSWTGTKRMKVLWL